MRLYEEIIFLQHHAEVRWVVENTVSYYKPLVAPQKIGRHFFWANFLIKDIDLPASGMRSMNKISDWEKKLGLSLSGYKISNKRQALRNCVDSLVGAHILRCALG